MMKNSILLLAIYVFISMDGKCQIVFARHYDLLGPTGKAEFVEETLDGGFFIAGIHGGFDGKPFAAKLDDSGNWLWSTEFQSSNFDFLYDAAVCSDGGYVLTGEGYNMGGSSGAKAFIIKVDEAGMTTWVNAYSATHGISILESSDENYVLAGHKNNPGLQKTEVVLLKVDNDGNILWEHRYKDQDYNIFTAAVKERPEGGFVICGSRYIDYNNRKSIVIQTDSVGEIEWSKEYDLPGADYFTDLALRADGKIFVVGTCTQQGDKLSFLCLDGEGEVLSSNFFSGGESAQYFIRSASITLSDEGNPIVTGATDMLFPPGASTTDVFLMETTDQGDPLWTKVYQGLSNSEDPTSVSKCADGGYIISASRSFSFGTFLIKTNRHGENCEYQEESLVEFTFPVSVSDIVLENLPGISLFAHSGAMVDVALDDENVNCVDTLITLSTKDTRVFESKVFPNPFNEKVMIETNLKVENIGITNSLGYPVSYRMVSRDLDQKFQLDLDAPAGIYFLSLRSIYNEVKIIKVLKMN